MSAVPCPKCGLSVDEMGEEPMLTLDRVKTLICPCGCRVTEHGEEFSLPDAYLNPVHKKAPTFDLGVICASKESAQHFLDNVESNFILLF